MLKLNETYSIRVTPVWWRLSTQNKGLPSLSSLIWLMSIIVSADTRWALSRLLLLRSSFDSLSATSMRLSSDCQAARHVYWWKVSTAPPQLQPFLLCAALMCHTLRRLRGRRVNMVLNATLLTTLKSKPPQEGLGCVHLHITMQSQRCLLNVPLHNIFVFSLDQWCVFYYSSVKNW